MAERKDSKGRLLKTGEYQRPDGRYSFKYVDAKGKTRFVYSWRLVNTDKIPSGKSYDASLREKIKIIQRDLNDEIDTVSSQETLNQRFEKYMKSNQGIKDTTRSGYYDVYRLHARDQLGHMKIKDIKHTDIKQRYVEMIVNDGLMPSSVEALQTVLFPIFKEAVADNIIRSNPADGVVKKINSAYKSYSHTEPRRALTKTEQKELLWYVKNSVRYSQWYPVIMAFLGTGFRAEELLALRWQDVDFENKTIDANHVLIYRGLTTDYIEGKHTSECHISEEMKTENSRRTVPMAPAVMAALEIQKEICKIKPCKAIIDGYTDFIFGSKNENCPLKDNGVNKALARIVERHNNELEELNKDGKEHVALPHITCHVFRHTFATRFAEVNPHADLLMALMGHGDIRTTYGIYAEVQEERKMQEQETMDELLYLNCTD